MGTVFLSYARENTEEAARIRECLQALGLRVWFDQRDLLATDDISDAIDKKIAEVNAVLVLWSAASRESVWVRGEALSGLSSNKYIGSQLDNVTPPVPFNARNAPNLADWTGTNEHGGWDLLVRSLAQLMSIEGPAVIEALERAQLAERAQTATVVASQAALPFVEAEQDEELEEEHAYQDIDALLVEAETILKGEGKQDFVGAITQAALNQELLRVADFVVDARRDVGLSPGVGGKLVHFIQQAVDEADDGALIVVWPGRYGENVRITRPVRIVGLGLGNDRAVVAAVRNAPTVSFEASARVENLEIETKNRKSAVYCSDHQPVLVRCLISRFSKSNGREDAAVYVAGKANPIVIATNITSADAPGLYFVTGSGGTFLGSSATSYRAASVVCRGQPKFKACAIEAIGGHAVEVMARGLPAFDDCDISGKGAPVVMTKEQARPQIRDSRVNAVRQPAFDFEGDSGGTYERNIVHVEHEPDAGTSKPKERGFWGFKAKERENAIVRAAVDSRVILLRSTRRPLFVSNTLTDGKELSLPGLF